MIDTSNILKLGAKMFRHSLLLHEIYEMKQYDESEPTCHLPCLQNILKKSTKKHCLS